MLVCTLATARDAVELGAQKLLIYNSRMVSAIMMKLALIDLSCDASIKFGVHATLEAGVLAVPLHCLWSI